MRTESSSGSEVKSQHTIETYKSMIQIAIEGFKLITLINGGAAVAILAYLGNIASKRDGAIKLPDMTCAISSFSLGVLCCAMGIICGYMTQLALFNDGRNDNPWFLKDHRYWLYIGLSMLIIASFAFGLGAYSAVRNF